MADILNKLKTEKGDKLFNELYETFGLKPEQVCRIRYFSANQDFRGSRDFEGLFKIYEGDPSIFDTDNIFNNPEDFLKDIGVTSLSQNDKRVKYATVAAGTLKDLKIEPYDLFNYFGKDVKKLREFLISKKGSGFGNKKTDMFIRDMIVLKAWKDPINFDKIDVASDINTVKVGLRTGILRTQIPLVSSFLDVFCHQYGLVDEMNALAWRKVWEIWKNKYPNNCIESPCLIDYFVYRIIGKEFCKEQLCLFKCEEKGHTFKWHSGRNKTCQICIKEGVRNKAYVVAKVLPCRDEKGHLVIEKNEYVSGDDAILKGSKVCPFASVCEPYSPSFVKLNPPKSISILGQTGWESARTTRGEGGGGLMS